jgi:hypothetical protein
MDLGIRLNFVKTSEFQGGGFETPLGTPLIHTYHAVPMLRCAVALRSRFQNGMVMA